MSRPMLVLLAVAIGLWVAATAWLWQRSSVAAYALLAICGVMLMLVARGLRTRSTMSAEAPDTQRAARFVVTQLLSNLTRMQVAYLSQNFSSEQEGRAWLKQAVPRGFRGALEELSADLEQARRGDPPKSLRLALRVLELRRELEPLEAALDQLASRYEGYALARPVAFVVTENVSEEGDAEPLVVSLAGWDPSKPTLLAPVEALTIYSGEGPTREVVGQVDFPRAERALQPHAPVEEQVDGQRILATSGVPLSELQLPLAEIPVGFVVGHSEILD